MTDLKRTLARSVGSLINLKPNRDYRLYTSVGAASFNAMSNDMHKVEKDLKKAINDYVKNKKYTHR